MMKKYASARTDDEEICQLKNIIKCRTRSRAPPSPPPLLSLLDSFLLVLNGNSGVSLIEGSVAVDPLLALSEEQGGRSAASTNRTSSSRAGSLLARVCACVRACVGVSIKTGHYYTS